jgi:CRP-like cAMP-binding protein
MGQRRGLREHAHVIDVLNAFLLGVLSALPLGIGAFTAFLWKPTNFVLGLLTAFGAGALLSAVTIDIVAEAVELGEFGWLAIGAVVGGLSFEGLNRVINDRGGFLRKASTSITFLRDREQRRRRQILDDLERIDIFDGLPDRELDAISEAFRTARLNAGDTLYRHGDPCEHLNVLAEGEISMATPSGTVDLTPFQAFGHLAFVSGTQHRSTAAATTDAEVLRLSRARLRSVLGTCPTFAERLAQRVHSDDLVYYLRTHHPEVSADEVSSWIATVDADSMERLPTLVEVATTTPTEQIIDHLRDVGPFRGLSHHALADVARLMFAEAHDTGFVFFRPGEAADRMYVIADGDVTLIDGRGESDESILLQAGEEFGSLSFLCGMRHSATAIAHTAADVWVLRRADLAELVRQDAAVREALGDFVRGELVGEYLQVSQELDPDVIAGFRRRALSAVRGGSLPPAVSANLLNGAPIAIWLGLLLDGIPESLVIGATAGAIQVSFIVGIALSNYPEALSSSVGMREQDFRWRSIALLWGTVVVVTGVGAAIGSVVFLQAPEQAFAVVEGLAAGAMLTVITQTMMPEALHRSGGFVGLAALAGFLFTTAVGV